MQKQTFKILFCAKSARISRNGELPVFVRLTIGGVRQEVTANLTVKREMWNSIAGKSMGKDKFSIELNNRLDTIRLRMMQIYRELEIDGIIPTTTIVMDKYLGRDVKPKVTILTLFREHNEKCLKMSGKDMAAGTVQRYETSLKHTENFIKFKYGKDDIAVEDIDWQFIDDYGFYLKTERNCNHNSTVKYLKNFKKIIRIAQRYKIITGDPFVGVDMVLNEVDRDFLEENELEIMRDKVFNIERIAIIRDIFIFCCYTNL